MYKRKLVWNFLLSEVRYAHAYRLSEIDQFPVNQKCRKLSKSLG